MNVKSEENVTVAKHPKALYYLFATEMWERFSYYGMASLLFLYLTETVEKGGLGFETIMAGQITGIYKATVYLTPILGGYLADKFMGKYKAIMLGAALMCLGHLALALPNMAFFYAGLVLLVFGNGFFKPNISTMLGEIYTEKNQLHSLRDAAFTLFYIGINLGAMLGMFATGYLAKYYGWHYGFGIAGVAMMLGMIIFSFAKKELAKFNVNDVIESKFETALNSKDVIDNQLLGGDELLDRKVIKDRLWFIVIMAFFTILFWAGHEQGSSSVVLFTERFVDYSVQGNEIPVTWVQNFNPFLIIVFGLPLAAFWSYLAKRKKDPSIVAKFIWALALNGIGFVVMFYATFNWDESLKISLLPIFWLYFFHTIGELFLSPLGLGMVSEMSPAHLRSTMMGVWLFAVSLANYLGATLAGFMDNFTKTYGYPAYFGIFIVFLTVAALLLLLLKKRLVRMMH